MPAFNEEEAIVAAVTNVRSALDRLTNNPEIIVVNDGSTDRTGERLDSMAADGWLRVLLRRAALARLALASTSYTINVEIIARAVQAGLQIREVPVTYRPRRTGRSKVGIADVPQSIIALLALRRALRDTPPD